MNKQDNPMTIPKYLTAEFIAPLDLSEDELTIWNEVTTIFRETKSSKVADVDHELIRQFCQVSVTRNRAWTEYNKKPERYTRIVVGVCQDGKTPKVVLKDNEYYKTWLECNKHLEVLLKDLGLIPTTRSSSRAYSASTYANLEVNNSKSKLMKQG